MAVYHGKRALVYMSTDGTGAATSVIKLNTWSLDMSADYAETTGFGDASKNYVKGFKDLKGALAGTWDDTSDTLYDASESTNGVKMYLYPSRDALTKYWYGPAWTDFKIDVGIGDAVRVSANFQGNGDWGQY